MMDELQAFNLLKQYGREKVIRYINSIRWEEIKPYSPVGLLFEASSKGYSLPFPNNSQECKEMARQCRLKHLKEDTECDCYDGYQDDSPSYHFCKYCPWYYNQPAPEELEEEDDMQFQSG